MNYFSWDISLIALLPAVALCAFIYYKDKIEKEPIGLLLALFLMGAELFFPTLWAERLILGGIDGIFAASISHTVDGSVVYSSAFTMVMHKLLSAFFGAALVEVVFKWLLLFLATTKNKNFNYLFDGVVYSVFVSLGFAAAENVRFALVNGWDTFVLHSLSSVPCHLIVGVAMGYFYTIWNAYRKANLIEEKCIALGEVKENTIRRPIGRLFMSLAVPFVISGFYLFAGTLDSPLISTLFYFAIFAMYGFSFITVDRISAKDKKQNKFSKMLLCQKHPEIDPSVWDKELGTSDEGEVTK
ncbi:MAG: PrsW family intramembrane metalloprotease [Ruminococcaceae bacterium]|nr:PrsW family intramembrane metalloprotease [Oscillospiraceae bacterium]